MNRLTLDYLGSIAFALWMIWCSTNAEPQNVQYNLFAAGVAIFRAEINVLYKALKREGSDAEG